jgi:hypothetical protein
VNLHVVLLCEHPLGGPFLLAGIKHHATLERAAARRHPNTPTYASATWGKLAIRSGEKTTIALMDALWRAWEHLRLDPATGISVWFRDHADPHMAVLLSEHGPFANCQLAHAHRGTEASHKDVPQLPSAAPPPGLLS